jgi:hypothetical protein
VEVGCVDTGAFGCAGAELINIILLKSQTYCGSACCDSDDIRKSINKIEKFDAECQDGLFMAHG